MKSEVQNKRKLWIDIVKGFAMIAIVAYHTHYCFIDYEIVPDRNLLPLRDFFGKMWHVPVFLMIGGFFLKNEELVKPGIFIKKKFKSLYLKMLIFYSIFILLHNFFFDIGFLSTEQLYGGKHIFPLFGWADYLKQFMWALTASREPFLGAMWFINLMFIGLCILSVLSWILSKSKSNESYEYKLGFWVVIIAIFSCILSHGMDIKIPRLSSALCVPLLLYAGFLINRKWQWKFDNRYLFVGSLFVVYETSMLYADVSMAGTKYSDTINLLVGTIAALYALCFISKKIESNILGKVIASVGSHSYYVMVFHLLGFKIATGILWCCGIDKPLDVLFSPASNLIELALYIVCGIVFSIIIEETIAFASRFLKVPLKRDNSCSK